VVVDRLRGDSVEAVTYIALPEANPGLPSSDYMRHLIEGAAGHSFPDDYVAMLKAVPVTEVV
jgi:hypothetical protein